MAEVTIDWVSAKGRSRKDTWEIAEYMAAAEGSSEGIASPEGWWVDHPEFGRLSLLTTAHRYRARDLGQVFYPECDVLIEGNPNKRLRMHELFQCLDLSHVTRTDLAVDVKDVSPGEFRVQRARTSRAVFSRSKVTGIQLGQRSSSRRVLVYDKALECGASYPLCRFEEMRRFRPPGESEDPIWRDGWFRDLQISRVDNVAGFSPQEAAMLLLAEQLPDKFAELTSRTRRKYELMLAERSAGLVPDPEECCVLERDRIRGELEDLVCGVRGSTVASVYRDGCDPEGQAPGRGAPDGGTMESMPEWTASQNHDKVP